MATSSIQRNLLVNAAISSAGLSLISSSDAAAQRAALGLVIGTDVAAVGSGNSTTITASEALSAGNLVNIWDSSGAKVRKADATVVGKEAHGFVSSAVSNGATATVNFSGNITGLSGLTPGLQFLSTTAGASSSTAPTASGNIVQCIGFATSTSTINFQSQPPILLA